jgi:hypothetical protein
LGLTPPNNQQGSHTKISDRRDRIPKSKRDRIPKSKRKQNKEKRKQKEQNHTKIAS